MSCLAKLLMALIGLEYDRFVSKTTLTKEHRGAFNVESQE